MGSKKKTTKVEPWAPAQPYILKGMEQTSQTFDQNQGMLQQMSRTAQDGFNAMAPGAFGTNRYVQNAQNMAGAIGSGGFLGTNPGASTYARLQNAGAGRSGGLFSRSTAAPIDPSTGYMAASAGGNYLNNQPSAGLYSTMMGQGYLNGNPYLDNMIAQTNADVTKNANRQFAARGMGSGLSSAFGDLLSKNLANNEGQLRYQNYNDASARQLQAAGQSDAAWGGERGRMDASAQALGAQYNSAQDRALEAAKAGDAAQSNQVQQMLAALGLTGDLRNAEYAGVAPALSVLNAAADTPYIGVGALNGNIRQASDGYKTTTEKTSGGLAGDLLGAAVGGLSSGIGGGLGRVIKA